MDQWNYNVLVVDMGGTGTQMGFARASITKMWEVRGPDGQTDWDRLQNMGREGWELVNSFLVSAGNGNTVQTVLSDMLSARSIPFSFEIPQRVRTRTRAYA